jgi:hypothetical protein
VNAPINLYHDVTPIGRVLGFFSQDITAIDGGFFFQALWIFVMQSAMIATTYGSVKAMPILAPVYLYGFFAGKYLKDMRTKFEEHFEKIRKGHSEKTTIHTKLSFSGRSVLKIYNKGATFTKILLGYCQDEQIMSRVGSGAYNRNDLFERLINFPT